jgi:hypothetical protein
MHGETLPPQENAYAPWIDEVQQSVAVPLSLNTKQNPVFIHQAGGISERRELYVNLSLLLTKFG